ncbi:class I SAM-dependent methyltransferase [Nodularia spumigena]|uniref:class I SAM-dependent methyltransferase n=1 Tax=Nodularia spumigena TaxID=70799 RepID=UPI00232C70A5|nr:class I SAM-dependent methyltransferase [Nodularia spumigena]MDB9347415.1 class I SAM-dependent methyltransferase [Nodularia spumigena CS-588/01]MDB9354461.1 class I SAM-dependent methyltransferase [Nodularia spumigena CS-588/05]
MNSLSSKLAEGVKCPVCNTDCSQPPLYRYSLEQATNHFCSATRNLERHERLKKVIHRLWQGNECVILQCPNCGFAFGYPFVGGDEEFYHILHEQKGYPSWRWDYDIAIQEVLAPLKAGKILEIGAGAGVFLQKLPSDWSPFAMEGSETTRTALEALNITVFRDFPEIHQFNYGNFQVITMFQVLEHIADFRPVLEQCRQLIATNGKIIITVPDGDAMIRQEKITGCPDMPPCHINKWTPDSLSLALIEAGFTPKKVIFEPKSWFNFRSSLYLRVLADASNPKSLAAQVYRVQNKTLRIPLLTCLGLIALIKMIPHFSDISKGGAFAIIADVSS